MLASRRARRTMRIHYKLGDLAASCADRATKHAGRQEACFYYLPVLYGLIRHRHTGIMPRYVQLILSPTIRQATIYPVPRMYRRRVLGPILALHVLVMRPSSICCSPKPAIMPT